MIRHHPRDHIGAAAGRERHDHPDGFLRPVLRGGGGEGETPQAECCQYYRSELFHRRFLSVPACFDLWPVASVGAIWLNKPGNAQKAALIAWTALCSC